ncbi:unnamed protein product [Polarella glacialis]|uniref:Uncharacterized protein n=1 Tax=Polarella glacialis TaxID=89957 RepID=A0A813JMT0_POLGL|nr:unnamed protein product [Polarella glacialis]
MAFHTVIQGALLLLALLTGCHGNAVEVQLALRDDDQCALPEDCALSTLQLKQRLSFSPAENDAEAATDLADDLTTGQTEQISKNATLSQAAVKSIQNNLSDLEQLANTTIAHLRTNCGLKVVWKTSHLEKSIMGDVSSSEVNRNSSKLELGKSQRHPEIEGLLAKSQQELDAEWSKFTKISRMIEGIKNTMTSHTPAPALVQSEGFPNDDGAIVRDDLHDPLARAGMLPEVDNPLFTDCLEHKKDDDDDDDDGF